jgi:4-hydroxybenzoate polyprenyltransferase
LPLCIDAVLKLQNIPLALSDWQYGILILSVLIAAAGYINDILKDTDLDNKPHQVIIGKTFLNLLIIFMPL